ncbi:MAG: hypothetical protein JKY18_04145 [Flavobacteriales bacterium]|nr:hypothetical protein [Flavobacteriales bacterium]MBL4734527.1 hypothetical protein [Flavobacteriales bacterium]
MNIQIENRDDFKDLLDTNLSTTGTDSKNLRLIIDMLHKELSSYAIDDQEEYTDVLHRKITQHIFSKYDSVIVTTDDHVYGLKGDKNDLLYKAPGTDIYVGLTSFRQQNTNAPTDKHEKRKANPDKREGRGRC